MASTEEEKIQEQPAAVEEQKTEEPSGEKQQETEEKKEENGNEAKATVEEEKEELGDPIPDTSEGEKKAEEEDDEELTQPQKEELEAAVMSDQYDFIFDLTHNYEDINIPITYLSASHAHLGDKTFLHIAAMKDLPNAIECLLGLGCDPGIVDNDGKTPYERCKSIETKESFVNFRSENPRKYDWARAKIPTSVEAAKRGRRGRGKAKKGSDDDDEEYRPSGKKGRTSGRRGSKKSTNDESESDD